ncbi:hypothetical protein CPC08DRAFT_803280 [Agrocybe pediades]|nr:hypothetical protein CPC08DRAFT_803280 [Agrocybe pediades]
MPYKAARATDSQLPPINVQKIIISANLNSTLLLVFLTGSSKHINKTVVLGSITALHCLMIAQTIIQWYYVPLVFSTLGDTRASIFIQSASGACVPPVMSVAIAVLYHFDQFGSNA